MSTSTSNLKQGLVVAHRFRRRQVVQDSTDKVRSCGRNLLRRILPSTCGYSVVVDSSTLEPKREPFRVLRNHRHVLMRLQQQSLARSGPSIIHVNTTRSREIQADGGRCKLMRSNALVAHLSRMAFELETYNPVSGWSRHRLTILK